MRKCNRRFAQRVGRDRGDRSNWPQMLTHSIIKNKRSQLLVNSLLCGLLRVVGVRIPGSWVRKTI